MALPFLILYLTRHQGWTAGKAGLAIAVYGVGAILVAPIAGKISDRIGSRSVMVGSLVLSALFLSFFPLINGFETTLLLTFVWSVVNEAFRPAGLSATTESVTPQKRKVALSFIRVAINLGMSIGPVIGGVLAMISYPILFWVDASTSLVAAFILLVSLKKKSSTLHEKTANAGHPLSFLKDAHLLYILALLIPVEIIFFQHTSSLPLVLINDLRMNETLYGLLFPINTLLITFVEVPLNSAMSHWDHRRSLALGALLFGVGFGALIFADSFFEVALTIVIWTFGEMIFLPTSGAYIADIAPKNRQGEYMGPTCSRSVSPFPSVHGWEP